MFVDVSGLIAHNPPRRHYGVAVADVDGDGRNEFIIAGYGEPNRVLRWSNGQLRDVAPPPLADSERQTIAVAAADIDGDGREELYFLNTDTFSGPKRFADRLFKAHPNGDWEDLFVRPEHANLRNLAAGRSVAAIDRRGVGRYGFFVANDGQPMRLYELSPDRTLADLAPALGLDRTTGGRGLLTLPIFSFHPDIICANENGPNCVFRNLGDGTFRECAGPLGLADESEHARGITAFDAGDGEFGLAWGNWDGPHRLMIRRDDGSWKDHATAGFAFPSAVRTVIAADFDNDGSEEIVFNNLGEPNRLFRLPVTGAAFETMMADPGEALDAEKCGTGAAVCDIDDDGILELLMTRGERDAQPLGLYKSRSAEGRNWLRVRPLTRFGAPARGAVVRAEAAGRIRVKGICGGSGYLGQMEPVAHFGFGVGSRAERVQVTWPDGAGVVLLNPGANRTITVPYPRG